jgi:hypothetical protein
MAVRFEIPNPEKLCDMAEVLRDGAHESTWVLTPTSAQILGVASSNVQFIKIDLDMSIFSLYEVTGDTVIFSIDNDHLYRIMRQISKGGPISVMLDGDYLVFTTRSATHEGLYGSFSLAAMTPSDKSIIDKASKLVDQTPDDVTVHLQTNLTKAIFKELANARVQVVTVSRMNNELTLTCIGEMRTKQVIDLRTEGVLQCDGGGFFKMMLDVRRLHRHTKLSKISPSVEIRLCDSQAYRALYTCPAMGTVRIYLASIET